MPAAPRTVSAFGEYGTWTGRPVKPPPPHPSVVPRRDGSRRSTHSPSRAARPSGPPWARGGWAGAKAGSGVGAGGAAGPAAVAFVPRGAPAQAMRVTAVTRAAAIESRRRGEVMVRRVNTPRRSLVRFSHRELARRRAPRTASDRHARHDRQDRPR